jgi:2,4-dienoyl-CoA reductase-like NADH-dependent reductase (Old Yellow Enzyme family)
VASFKSAAAFRAHLATLPIALDCDEELLPPERSPLAQPITVGGRRLGNRFAVQPMEGWDGTVDGKPSTLTLRRWKHFGLSGAKLIWGGEAVAVRRDGRANPNQLYFAEDNRAGLEELLQTLKAAHRERFGTADDLLVGVQLTHSGRFCRPEAGGKPAPRIAYRHPILDRMFGIESDRAVFSDAELDGLIGDFVRAARQARQAGFDLVDIKHCHGYLLHELLSAHTRPGRYGGSLENRTRMLGEIVAGIRRDAPGLMIAVRVSIFDLVPFRKPAASGGAEPGLVAGPPGGPAETQAGRPADVTGLLPYRFAFGANADHPTEIDLAEPIWFLEICRELEIPLINLTAGSPYYNPHIQRPAFFPPSDGYGPPEDPLTGCARMIAAAAACKRAVPGPVYVGTGYSYLQEYIPLVAQAQVRLGHIDLVGLGRSTLSYPDLPADILSGTKPDSKRFCRTFSDCTTAPRNGLVSGCYPLDPHYKAMPEAKLVKQVKARMGEGER